MQDLKIDTEEMASINNKLSSIIDEFPSGKKFESISIDNGNCVSGMGISSLNTSISTAVSGTNKKIKTALSEATDLVSSSKKYVTKLVLADGTNPKPKNLSNDLPGSANGVKMPPQLDYGKQGTKPKGKKASRYNRSVFASLALGDKKGPPQGFTQATVPTTKNDVTTNTTYNIVTSYTDDNGIIRVYNSAGKLLKTIKVPKSHLGGAVYKDGRLYLAGGKNVTSYDFSKLMSSGGKTIEITKDDQAAKAYGFSKFKVPVTDNNPSGTASYIGLDEYGNIVVGEHHNGNESKGFDTNPATDLIAVTVDSNGRIVKDVDGKPVYSVSTVTSSKTRQSVKDVTDGLHELQGVYSETVFGETQTFLSSSYYANQKGEGSKSKIVLVKPDENGNITKNSVIATYKLPAGAEQITRLADGNYAIVYETKGKRRVDFVSADYFMRSSAPEYNEWKKNKWSKEKKFVDSNGKIYVGSMAAPIRMLTSMSTNITALKTAANSCEVGSALKCSTKSKIDVSKTSLVTELNVLSNLVNNLKSSIWNVTNNYKKTDTGKK